MGGENVSYPILYESNATDFFNLGLGTLPDAISALVTEERNGEFVFDMAYPLDGTRADQIKNNRIIKANAGHKLKDQLFVIKTVMPIMDNSGKVVISIYAEHISYITNDLMLKAVVEVNNADGKKALETWRSSITEKNNITVDSDIDTVSSTEWRINEVQNARQALGGVEGSILDRWHGEYRFDNLHVSLLKARGTTANTLLSYGRNITDFKQEENIISTYTSIYPYALLDRVDHNDGQTTYTIDGYIVDSKYVNNFPNRKILPVDFSSKFENVKVGTKPADADKDTTYISEDEVRSRLTSQAQAYIKNNNVGVPKVSIKLSFIDLSKTTNYVNSALLEQVDLCDEVPVRFSKLGINTTAKVSRVVWNVLTDSYETIELGEIQATLGDKINQISQDNRQRDNALDKWKNIVQTAANGINTIFRGPNTPTANHVGDLWYKPDGEYVELRQWDGSNWVFLMSTRETAEIKEAVEKAQQEAETAKKQAQDAVDKANIADINARQGIKDAAEALGQAHTVSEEVTQLKGGSTVTLAQLEDGLKQTITSGEFESYRAETAKLIQDKVSSSEFESFRSQTANALQDRVTSTQFESVRTQLDDQITSVVKTQTAENTNLIVNGAFKDGSYWRIESGTSVGFYSEMNDVPISAGTYIRTMDNSASYSVVQRPSSAVIKALRGKTVTVSIYGRASGTSSDKFRMYIRTTATDGTFSYINSGKYYTINNGWQRFSFTAVLPTDITAANITFNMQELSGVNVYLTGAQLNLSDQLLPYSESIEDFANQSQITQLVDDINLRVKVDDVVNQINVSKEGILIDGMRTHITNQTTIDNAVIKSAMVDTIKADQITTGTLNAANVDIINLNVNKLVGNTTSFVQTAWNNVSKYVSIDSSGISVGSGEASTELLYDGMHLYDAYKGEDVGVVRAIHRYGATSLNGIAFDLNAIGDYMMWTARSDDDTKYEPKMLYIKPRATASMLYNKGFTFNDDVTFAGLIRPDGASNSGFKFGTIRYHDIDYAAIYHPARQAGILFGGSNLLLMVGGTIMGLGGLIFPTEVSSDGRILHSAKL